MSEEDLEERIDSLKSLISEEAIENLSDNDLDRISELLDELEEILS